MKRRENKNAKKHENNMSEEEQKKALLITWDGAGNLIPELALAKALVERGHAVDVLGHDSHRDIVLRAGCGFRPLSNVAQHDSLVGMSPEEEMTVLPANIWFAKGYATDLVSAIDGLSPHLLLVDGCLASALAEALGSGLPTVPIWHTLYELVVTGPFAELFNSYVEEFNGAVATRGLGPFATYQEILEASDRVIVSSFAPFDTLGAQFAPQVLHVGPLRSKSNVTDGWVRSFPDRSLVLVALSTSDQQQGPLLQRLCDALAGLDVEALVTTGPALDPASLSTAENVNAVEFVSHDNILPETDLLITHAGHGTVMAGVTYGVPMLCVPMGRDQNFVAARVAELDLGASMEATANIDSFRQAIWQVLGDQSIRGKCRAFAESISGHAGIEKTVQISEQLMGVTPAKGAHDI